MSSHDMIRSLFVVLTARCNLSCGYCFQNDKKDRRMKWETLRSSIDLVLNSRQDEVDLVFFGGEPLMELAMMRKAVDYVRIHLPPGKKVNYALITNGTLLRGDILDFVILNEIDTQVSFDGVMAAQDYRGQGTFKVLDHLVDRLRLYHPDFFQERFSISATLVPATIAYLAESVEYFLSKGIPKIKIYPTITNSSDWRPECISELRAQFERIVETSLDHYQVSGRIPLATLQRMKIDSHNPTGRSMCGVMRGETPAVDVDGQVHGCVTFAESYQAFPSELLRTELESIGLGDLGHPEFNRRYADFSHRVKEAGIFNSKQDKYSSYASCKDCRYLRDCAVCPVSIGHIPGNRDPNRVPDFLCAFNLVSLAYRDLFQRRIGSLRPAPPPAIQKILDFRAAARRPSRDVRSVPQGDVAHGRRR